jgi:serine protease Do
MLHDLMVHAMLISALKRRFASKGSVQFDRRLTLHYELDNESGVRVQSVERGSPAEAAGLESGDLIVSYDREPTTSIDRLQKILDSRRINKSCEIVCLRRGQKLELTAIALERPG